MLSNSTAHCSKQTSWRSTELEKSPMKDEFVGQSVVLLQEIFGRKKNIAFI